MSGIIIRTPTAFFIALVFAVLYGAGVLFIRKIYKNRRYDYTFYVSRYVEGVKFSKSPYYTVMRVISSCSLIASVIILLFMTMGLSTVSVENRMKDSGHAVLFTIDISPSMAIYDGEGNSRIDIVKRMIRRFLTINSGAYVAIMTFGDTVNFFVPFSQDYEAIDQLLESVRIGELGDGSALADALLYSQQIISSWDAQKSDIVFFSDGIQNSGSIYLSQVSLIDMNISLNIMHVVTDQNGFFSYKNFSTGSTIEGYVKQRSSSLLQDTAKRLNARYVCITNMRTAYDLLDHLGAESTSDRVITPYNSYSDITKYLMCIFLILCVIFVIIRCVLLRRMP